MLIVGMRVLRSLELDKQYIGVLPDREHQKYFSQG